MPNNFDYLRINVHSHLMNFNFVPHDIIKKLSPAAEKFTQSKINPYKYMISNFVKFYDDEVISDIISGNRFNNLEAYLKIFSHELISQATSYVTENCYKNRSFDVFVPIIMDLTQAIIKSVLASTDEISSKDLLKQQIESLGLDDVNRKHFINKINSLSFDNLLEKLGVFPYSMQILQASEVTYNFPWRVYPFLMFDPRNEGAFELIKVAIEQHGYIGIKIYPAIGYYPDPEMNITCNNADIKKAIGDADIVARNLEMCYEYCSQNNIPLIIHSSIGSAYDTQLSEAQVINLCKIDNWKNVLKKYKLKVNFAHFGGNYIILEEENLSGRSIFKRAVSTKWRDQIIDLMQNPEYGEVYADLAYNDQAYEVEIGEPFKAIETKRINKYFENLEELLGSNTSVSERILFGTDYPMITHTWSDKYVTENFQKRLCASSFKKIISDNPIKFLFGSESRLPDNYIKFLGTKNALNRCKPNWVKEINSVYYLKD